MQMQKEKVDVGYLAVGMYVCELDRPWLETPFLMQGFLIESKEEIEALSRYCDYVYVDVAKGKLDVSVVHSIRSFHKDLKTSKKPSPGKTTAEILSLRTKRRYTDTTEWRKEVGQAHRAVEGLTTTVKEMFEALSQNRRYPYAKLKQSVTPLVNSIERNPDACIWLARLKNRDSYIYKHSVATSIWAVALGRELALPPQDLKSLAMGALMLDVGKLQIPSELLNKSDPLNAQEEKQLRQHVNFSLQALEKSQLLNQDIWDMVAYHHERHNGSGYPRGLQADEIPLFARIAGIVDSYDAMISHRYYEKPVSPSEAVKKLYHLRDVEYDAILVEEFIQAIGLYPAGTLVLLSTGEVAIVLSEGRARRLKPQVLLLLDKNKNPLNKWEVQNLADRLCPATNKPVDIVQSLEPGAYGVNPEMVAYEPA
ncbi:HD-GYP domain-containing protein [Aurantivibrio plasticivorans]